MFRMPMMSSASSSYTGKRDRPDSRMVDSTSSPVSSAHTMTISVRWIITSSAVVLLNSKIFSINSFSEDSMAPRSSPRSTIMRISSSLTSSSSALGSMWSRRSTPLVDLDSSQITGRKTTATAATAPTVARATASVFFMAMRLGTSSPSTRLK